VVSDRLPTELALPLPRWFKDKTKRWLEPDMDSAEIDYENEYGFADFHALRGAFVTALVRSGANPRMVQTLARHSTAALSIATYTHLRRDDERRAIEAMPSLSEARCV
jgi:integrase